MRHATALSDDRSVDKRGWGKEKYRLSAFSCLGPIVVGKVSELVEREQQVIAT
jgi:hypothetical protein